MSHASQASLVNIMAMDERRYKIAFSLLPGVKPDIVWQLLEDGVSATDFFTMAENELSEVGERLSISTDMTAARQGALAKADEELRFIDLHGIRVLFIADAEFPRLLAQTNDSPIVLYVLGNFDFNSKELLAMVGTRKVTSYGMKFSNDFVEGLSQRFPGRTAIVSGLAYGVDACAHKASLDYNVPTVAVLAHGLHMIYPAQHRSMASEIIKKGGAIVTEYLHGTSPFQRNFLERNRIVAGMSEGVVVVETPVKGGAISTANIAFSYNRDLFAVPGRVSDETSQGCLQLIRKGKAQLITGIMDVAEALGWPSNIGNIPASKRNLFPELDGDAARIYEHMRMQGVPQNIDSLHEATRIPIGRLMTLLCELEFEGIVNRIPGNSFELA